MTLHDLNKKGLWINTVKSISCPRYNIFDAITHSNLYFYWKTKRDFLTLYSSSKNINKNEWMNKFLLYNGAMSDVDVKSWNNWV